MIHTPDFAVVVSEFFQFQQLDIAYVAQKDAPYMAMLHQPVYERLQR